MLKEKDAIIKTKDIIIQRERAIIKKKDQKIDRLHKQVVLYASKRKNFYNIINVNVNSYVMNYEKKVHPWYDADHEMKTLWHSARNKQAIVDSLPLFVKKLFI